MVAKGDKTVQWTVLSDERRELERAAEPRRRMALPPAVRAAPQLAGHAIAALALASHSRLFLRGGKA